MERKGNRLMFESVEELGRQLEHAGDAHGEYEAATGVADAEWPAWSARHLYEDGGASA